MRIMAVVPVYNEAENIGNVLETLIYAYNEGTIDGITVVNDGSTDATQSIAAGFFTEHESRDFFLLDLKENMGKGAALLAGFLLARSAGHDAVIMLDADMDVLPIHLGDIAEALERNDEKMIIGIYYERNHEDSTHPTSCLTFSGFRAITLSALSRILDNPFWQYSLREARFGAEKLLNYVVGRFQTNGDEQIIGCPGICTIDFTPRIFARPGCRYDLDFGRRQGDELTSVSELIFMRRQMAQELRKMRGNGSIDEAKQLIRLYRRNPKEFIRTSRVMLNRL